MQSSFLEIDVDGQHATSPEPSPISPMPFVHHAEHISDTDSELGVSRFSAISTDEILAGQNAGRGKGLGVWFRKERAYSTPTAKKECFGPCHLERRRCGRRYVLLIFHIGLV
jgi:hypothetical protein